MALANSDDTPPKHSIARSSEFMPMFYTLRLLAVNYLCTDGARISRNNSSMSSDRDFLDRSCRAARLQGCKLDVDIATLFGVSSQTFWNWKQRGRIPAARHAEIARKLGTTIDDLMHPDHVREHRATYTIKPTTRLVPLVGNTQGGLDVSWDETGYPVGHADEYVNTSSPDPSSYGLRVRGDSMYPRMREGDAVVTQPSMSPTPGDEVVIRWKSGAVAVKVYAQNRNGLIALDSYNAAHPRITARMEEIEFMHVVVGIHPPAAIIPADPAN